MKFLNKFKKLKNSLKGRLSLWYFGSISVIFLSFAIISSLLFWYTLKNQIDHHIHIAVNEARQIVQNYYGEERDSLIKNLVSARGMTVIVLSPDGAPILETNSPDIALVAEHELQTYLAKNALENEDPIHFTYGNIRFAAMPVNLNTGRGVVAVGYSTFVLYDALYKMMYIIIGTLLFLVIPATYVGYSLLSQQLKPIELISNFASNVPDNKSLTKRLKVKGLTNELETIQNSLNSMVERLQVLFNTEQEFFADAAHTLKTPLAVLRSQIENSNLTKTEKERFYETIDVSTSIIRDLLFLSRINFTKPTRTKFSLTELVTEIVEVTSALGETKNLKIKAKIQKDVDLYADKNLIRKALSNLAHNAVIYNKMGGEISIVLSKTKGKIFLSISDTGIGVEKDHIKSIFNRFYRGKNTQYEGSGLGLAITKAVIKNEGGEINVESTLGKGSTFTVIF